MGAWGAGVFENNDAAMDWVIALESRGGIGPVLEALERSVGESNDYLDADDGSMALAAAEAVAAARAPPRRTCRKRYVRGYPGMLSG